MKIWLAYLSGRQRSSQISSKEVERIGAHVRVILTLSPFTLPLAVILQLSPPLPLVATKRHVIITCESKENNDGGRSRWCCG